MITIKILCENHDEALEVYNSIENKESVYIGLASKKHESERLKRLKRLDFVLSIINNKEVSQEVLYKRARKRGYAMTRKTFTRDINELIEENKISKEVLTGGIYGTTSIINRL